MKIIGESLLKCSERVTSGGCSKLTSRATSNSTVLTCPAANNTIYTDVTHTSYEVHCAEDNSASSFNTVTIDEGGFSSCFSSCSNATACAGFTYVGLDSGSCYLKDAMPDDEYVATSDSNYVSCVVTATNSSAAINSSVPAAVATTATGTGATDTQSKTNLIAGSAAGGAAAFLLCILAIVLITRRRRRKHADDSRKATKMSSISTPTESPAKGEAFASYGGFYRGSTGGGEDNLEAKSDRYNQIPEQSLSKTQSHDNYPPVQHSYNEPVYKQGGLKPAPFIAEMEDTSLNHLGSTRSPVSDESPVLGRDSSITFELPAGAAQNVLTRQPVMSWDSYGGTRAISPPSRMSSTMSSRPISPYVSPSHSVSAFSRLPFSRLPRTNEEAHHSGAVSSSSNFNYASPP